MKRALSAVLAPVFAGAFILSACMTPAAAQTTSATVVATCGTPPATYSPGANRALTQDTTGTLCSTGSGGGGGGNDAASATGAAVPAKADYQGLNVGGTLRGQTAVNPTGSVYAGQTDLTSVNGVTALTGAGAVGTGSARVAVGQDTTTVAGAAPLTTGIYVTGPSAAALATSANQSSVIGTKAAGTAATNSQLTGGVYNSSPPSLSNGQQAATQMTSAGSTKVLDDNSAALLAAAQGPIPAQSTKTVNIGNVGGIDASGATVTGQPLLDGGRAATAAPTAVTDGQAVAQLMGETGKQIVLPYSIKENAVRGTATSTDTSAHTIIASAGGSLKNYITGVQCGRTDAGASALTITFNDSASTIIILPAGGATNVVFNTPLATAAATAFQFTFGTGVTTGYCSAQGYVGL